MIISSKSRTVLSMIEARSLIQCEASYVITTHICGKLKRNMADLDYIYAKDAQTRQRYLINFYAALLWRDKKNLRVFAKQCPWNSRVFFVFSAESNKFYSFWDIILRGEEAISHQMQLFKLLTKVYLLHVDTCLRNDLEKRFLEYILPIKLSSFPVHIF